MIYQMRVLNIIPRNNADFFFLSGSIEAAMIDDDLVWFGWFLCLMAYQPL